MGLLARDLMTKDVVTVTPDSTVKDAARIMVERNVGALPVLDPGGKLVGIVAEADLIMQDVRVRPPYYLSLLGGFIELESISHFEQEVRKAVALSVSDVMASPVVTASPDTDVEAIATMMTEKDFSRIPIVENGSLVGIVSKHDIVRSISRGE